MKTNLTEILSYCTSVH